MAHSPVRRTALSAAASIGAVLLLAVPASAAKNGPIVFQAYPKGLAQLFTVNPDGSGQKQLTHVTGDPEKSPGAENPAWSPDASTIAFDTGDDEHGVNLFTMAAGGGPFTQIPLVNVFMFSGDPAYSPDGSMISFDEDSGPGQPDVHGIFIANADGTGTRQLTTAPPRPAPNADAPYDTQSEWSPDGKRIAFTRVKREGSAAIWVIGVDGTGLRRLTPFRADAGNPNWSPDGTKLVFNTHFDPGPGQSANIYVMRPDGSHKKALTHKRGGKAQFFAPTWSPNGKRIAFTCIVPVGKRDFRGDICTMTPKGKRMKRVTHMPHAFPRNADWGTRP